MLALIALLLLFLIFGKIFGRTRRNTKRIREATELMAKRSLLTDEQKLALQAKPKRWDYLRMLPIDE
jgi:hypothetical protein